MFGEEKGQEFVEELKKKQMLHKEKASLSKEEKENREKAQKLKEMIENAETLEEIVKIEEEMKKGNYDYIN